MPPSYTSIPDISPDFQDSISTALLDMDIWMFNSFRLNSSQADHTKPWCGYFIWRGGREVTVGS